MELFKLLGTIAIDNKSANEALDDTSEKGAKAESKLSKVFGGIGKGAAVVGKAVATGMVAAGTAVVGLVSQATSSYAEYEQLVGGVETLFKDSASKVMEYANKAYQTAGMSANEYMSTVTSFSASLLQSLGGDTEAAADKADMAIRDMSDNANKMGTSMEMIQNAYNGFAKQNYTMLDNLKLGYGGTKEEMARLLADAEKLSGQKFDISSYGDIVDAIHVVQTEMGITGTTAAEAAGTISGSMASVKASWQNLITAMADDNADLGGYIDTFVNSAATMTENMLPRIGIALNGVVQLIDQLAPVVLGKIPDLLSQLLPSVVSAATGIIGALVDILPGLVTTITDILPALIEGFTTVINGLISAIPDIIQALVKALPTMIKSLVAGLTSVFTTISKTLPQIIQALLKELPGVVVSITEALLNALPTLVEGISAMFTELVAMLPEVLPVIIEAVISIITMLGEQLPVIIPQIVNAIIMMVTFLIEQLPTILPIVVQAISQIFTLLLDQLTVLLPILLEAAISIVNLIIQQLPVIMPMLIQAVIDVAIALTNAIITNLPAIVSALVQAIPGVLKAVWDAIVLVFVNLPQWFGQIFSGAVELIMKAFSVVGAFFQGIWDGLCEIFAPVGEWFSEAFSGAWENIKKAFAAVSEFFSGIWSDITEAFDSVITWFGDLFSDAWEAIKEVFSGVGEFFGGIWTTISTKFSDLGTTISDAITGAVKSGINGLLGSAEGIINGFLKMINGAISLINEIPGVNISKVKLVEFTRLAKGGVVDEPTPAVFGEDGAEAVVPLENNTGWMRKVAKDIHTFMIDPANQQGDHSVYGYSARSTKEQSIVASIRAEVEAMKDTLGGILDHLDLYLPSIRERMDAPVPAVIGADQAADALVEPINYRLGLIAAMEERGRY